jgi:glycosyltransferase involved in cell wall biosynthesis
MKYSVIIPSYNKALPLMLTLTAFETQTYPHDQFEVVVVNDGSTDDTMERLSRYRPPYRLVPVSLKETAGRSAARNLGVAAASGDMLIFCDPDFLVTPDFVQTHETYHRQHPNAVVSGVPILFIKAYPHLYPDFSAEEKVAAAEVLQASGLWSNDYWHTPELIEIVTPEDLLGQTGKLEKIVSPWESIQEHYREFPTTDVAPWLMAVTRNLSLSKRLFKEVGGFNESFLKHGLEDWELGYRLHRHGCSFISIAEVIGYHQEHPSFHRSEDSQGENLRIFYQNHGYVDPEISLFAILPPSEGMEAYKNTLRILKSLRGSKRASDRAAARQIRRTLSHGARLFHQQPEVPEYKALKDGLKPVLMAAAQIYSQTEAPQKQKQEQIKAMLTQACQSLWPDSAKPSRHRRRRKRLVHRGVRRRRGIRRISRAAGKAAGRTRGKTSLRSLRLFRASVLRGRSRRRHRR